PPAKEHTPGQIIPDPELAEGCILNVGLRQAQPPAKEHTPGQVIPAPELAEGCFKKEGFDKLSHRTGNSGP
ncbi:MAG: hypothetical protein ACKO16_02615, partial [Gemmataceae bacterium]